MPRARQQFTIRKLFLLLYDLTATVISLIFALVIRFEAGIPAEYMNRFFSWWYLFPISGFIIFFIMGFYDQIWRFASISQYLLLALGTLIQTVLAAGVMILSKLAWNTGRFPYSVYIIYWFIIFMAVIGFRVAYRVVLNRTQLLVRFGDHFHLASHENVPIGSRVLIFGAGAAGGQIIREMLTSRQTRTPIVVVDDNPRTHYFKIMGVPVLGDRYAVPDLVKKFAIDEIILAIPSAPKQAIRDIVEICSRTGKPIKTIPFLKDLIDGRFAITDIKNVEIEDLLGRDEVNIDISGVAEYLSGQTVLVTGGGGSIGSELCRQIVQFNPQRLIIFDIYENNAYDLQQDFHSTLKKDIDIVVLIGSVRDPNRLEQIFSQYHPAVVFHAAAHKHVPLMEDSPEEAVKNNIYGTYNVADMAGKYHAARMVLVSTDKAVRPTNVMGATKRFAEIVMQAMNQRYPHTRYVAVRFGNVLGSSGSVIPLFKKQIERDRVVTVTHPEITRYFMTIPEAARLVIQAGALAAGGEIFVLDMGQPVKIVDLARDLIRLSGLEPDVDVQIKFTGLRPGEKMYEELYFDQENMDSTKHAKILVLKQVHDHDALRQEITDLRSVIRWRNANFVNMCNSLIEQIDQVESSLQVCRRRKKRAIRTPIQ